MANAFLVESSIKVIFLSLKFNLASCSFSVRSFIQSIIVGSHFARMIGLCLDVILND